ncbi:helix-turn-helix domain-containing protein [Gluconacetobacter asukensis]|uniref:Helix-turn-helix domain-containing protein n=1 Tax=Gluconacetobacter asukensis TaxID=1017181 RepID=A0A7W4IZS1_9PROT|nr:helix-turn-helix domain-containing protein [Gluconacetobacter asukensis]MBB2171967.1 helix-turn-helix domain-containing protein [Gluconacetobacter asukensis]
MNDSGARASTGAAGVGPALRARREQLGWALPDVATWLRIRLSFLEAMEEGRVKDLPGNVYTLGFLRTYAQALGLDADAVVTRFKADTRGSIDCKPELSFPAPASTGAMPVGVMVLLGGVIIVLAYVGWYRMTDGQSAPPQPVPSVFSAIPGMTRQAPTSPQVASVLPPERAPIPPRPLPEPEKSAITDGDIPAEPTPVPGSQVEQGASPAAPAANADASAAPVAVPSMTQPAAPGTAPVPVSPPAQAPAPAAATPAGQIVLTASAQTWVQVRVAGGPVIYDHILQAGESWSAPQDKTDLLLTVGNAGGLVVSADGVTTQPLGRNGTVRRNLPLTRDAVRSGSIVAAVPAPTVRPAPAAAPERVDGAGHPPAPQPAPAKSGE